MENINGTQPVWAKDAAPFNTEKLTENQQCDVCIVGAGIAGLTCAYLLLKEGRSVIVIDKDQVCGGESFRTTAHLVNVLDDRFYNLIRYHGNKGARLAAQSHTSAIALIEEIIKTEQIDCEFERVNGYLFTGAGRPENELQRELEAMHEAGLGMAAMIGNAPITSFNTGTCILVQGQGKFQPMLYFSALAQIIMKRGGKIFTSTKAMTIEGGAAPHVITEDKKEIRCSSIVVASNSPVNDLYAVHTRQSAYRTYVITAEIPKAIVADSLYWDTGDPYHYIRLDKRNNDAYDLLTVGGEDHKTGQEENSQKRFKNLERWTRDRFPIGKVLYQWSGQVMEPNDGLAFIGHNPHDHKNVYIITGDSGNGMTHGTLGARLISDLIVGRPNPWESLYDPSRITPMASGTGIKEFLNMSAQYLDWIKPGNSIDDLSPGKGMVIRQGLKRIAVYKDHENNLHALDATCSHLGCVVQWNHSEKSWDCPCHGSRFSIEGKVINGPALANLMESSDFK